MPARVLTLLVLVNALNFLDRNLLSILVQPIRDELRISDTAMGFLLGPAFALFYTFAGIPIGRLADRYPRRWVLSLGITCWSLATAASGLVRSFWQMALARLAVSIGEASATPTSHSLISDVFPPGRRATAIAIYSMGASLGAFAGLALGGLLREAYGWRGAFVVAGLGGALFGVAILALLPEPRRGASDAAADASEPPGLWSVLLTLLARRSFRQMLAGAALVSIVANGMGLWAPPFFERVHGADPIALGTILGLSFGGGGALGAFLGGVLADRLSPRDVRWLAWVPALSSVALVPALAGFALAPSAPLALIGLLPAATLNQFYPAPSFAAAQALAPLRMRAVASAVVLFAISLIGLGIGPLLVGALNDLFAESLGDRAIRASMLIVGAFNLWGAFHYLRSARWLRADLNDFEA